jgi:hypothetical protein
MFLTILTFDLGFNHSIYHIQFLIIFPPLNCLFIFLFSVTWLERRFRLSYIPLICLILLFCSTLTLTIVSSLLLFVSIILYLNLIFYALFTCVFFVMIIMLLGTCLYETVEKCRSRFHSSKNNNNNEIDVRINGISKISIGPPPPFEQLIVRSTGQNDFVLIMSVIPIEHRRDLIEYAHQIQVDLILTLSDIEDLSWLFSPERNIHHAQFHSFYNRRMNIEQLFYPIRNRFIPKSISDYMQFLYGIIENITRLNHRRILIHSRGGLGRTGLTMICLSLFYEYMMTSRDENDEDIDGTPQRFVERFYHYPFILKQSCRVCQSLVDLRKLKKDMLYNPLQILFIHEFYARLKSPSYMQQIKDILQLNDKLISTRMHV